MSKQILAEIINPALDRLAAHRIPVTDAARVMLYAIGLQESNLQHRFQISQRSNGERFRGPARGFWQFEIGGGVAGVMAHKSSADIARAFTAEFVGSNSTNNGAIWATLAYEDILAAVFARLLLWTDPRPLPPPTPASEQEAWDYYIRNWRPGKPHPGQWSARWKAALDLIK